MAGSFCSTDKETPTLCFWTPQYLSTCRALSFQVRLGNGFMSSMSKNNKEGETSKENPAVFIIHWSLAEPQMVQTFEVLPAALFNRTYGSIFLCPGPDWMLQFCECYLYWMLYFVLQNYMRSCGPWSDVKQSDIDFSRWCTSLLSSLRLCKGSQLHLRG